MARSFLSVAKSIGDKAGQLARRIEQLEDENKALRQEADDLREQTRQAREDLHRVQLEVDFLTVSYRIADKPEKLADARRHVANLIRILDRCIDLLKDDPRL